MQQATAFLEALKRCLKAKGVNYLDVATKLGISHTSVKRIFSAGTLSLSRVGAILEAFDLTFVDVARLVDSSNHDEEEVLTFEQESVLAADRKLFAFFHLLLFGRSPEKVVAEFMLSRAQCDAYVKTLLSLGLVERRTNGKVRPLTGRNVQWREDGPLRQAYALQIREEFLSGSFAEDHEIVSFSTRSLSLGSQTILKRRIQRLIREAKELAAVDRVDGAGRVKSCGLIVGFRPYAFSVVKALPRRS